MKAVRWVCLVVLVGLIFAGCATTTIESAYQLDFRSAPIAVMLNEQTVEPVGRAVPISYTFSASSSTTTGYNVTITTTRTSESSIGIANQLLMNVRTNDGLVVLKNVRLNYHIMMAPYYGENSRLVAADAIIVAKGRLK
jgi:hypothetical protein